MLKWGIDRRLVSAGYFTRGTERDFSQGGEVGTSVEGQFLIFNF